MSGVDARMVKVLRNIGVELTRYHGGSLTGMDINKLIANAPYVFDEFAKILKSEHQQNPHCKLSDVEIDLICEQHKELYFCCGMVPFLLLVQLIQPRMTVMNFVYLLMLPYIAMLSSSTDMPILDLTVQSTSTMH